MTPARSDDSDYFETPSDTRYELGPMLPVTAERHPATADVWDWLENGEGRTRSDEDKQHIREILLALDADFLWFSERRKTP